MITDSDTDFHPRDPADLTWTETNFLPFVVPEAGVFGNVYVLARPNVGVATSSILVGQGLCRQPFEIDFTDPQVHLPCPESFSEYTLANGLSVQAPSPRDYRFSYRNRLDACSFQLRFEGLHQPFARFGFIVEQGEVHPIVQATIEATHLEMLVTGNHIRATDARGREYEFFGAAIAAHPWYSFNPCHVSFQSILRCQWDGRVGYGRWPTSSVWTTWPIVSRATPATAGRGVTGSARRDDVLVGVFPLVERRLRALLSER